MKTNHFLVLAMVILLAEFVAISVVYQNGPTKPENYHKIFSFLPITPVYQTSDYKLIVDTLRHKPSLRISGRLYYQGREIWYVDSTQLLSITHGGDDVLLIQETYSPLGHFHSFLFYNGSNITGLAHPSNQPQILEYRRSSQDKDLLCLFYDDPSNLWHTSDGNYSLYNLKTQELLQNK